MLLLVLILSVDIFAQSPWRAPNAQCPFTTSLALPSLGVTGLLKSGQYTRSQCADALIEGLVWHDLGATYGTTLGEAGFSAYDIAKLMGHAKISTSQRYIRNLPVGAGEPVMLQISTVTANQPPRSAGVRAL